MARKTNNHLLLFSLKNMPVIMFLVIFIGFSVLDQRFFSFQNFDNILRSSSFVGIIAVGMTFVLLTGGIDLSVGAIMYVSGGLVGILLEQNVNLWLAILVGLLSGIVFGMLNAFVITKFRIIPFMATLGTLTAGRGLALLITHSRALSFPDSIKVGAVKVFNLLPIPVVVFIVVVAIAVIILKMTPLGRQIYALGNDVEAAKKAGLNTDRLIAFVYVVSGLCAALAAIVAITQQGRVSASFGSGIEFRAIAAAVLGGTSLFGGIGMVFPGTFIGILLMQMIQTGMVYLQVDGYLQDIVVAGVIFFAIFIDSRRMDLLHKLERRTIRVEKVDHNPIKAVELGTGD